MATITFLVAVFAIMTIVIMLSLLESARLQSKLDAEYIRALRQAYGYTWREHYHRQ